MATKDFAPSPRVTIEARVGLESIGNIIRKFETRGFRITGLRMTPPASTVAPAAAKFCPTWHCPTVALTCEGTGVAAFARNLRAQHPRTFGDLEPVQTAGTLRGRHAAISNIPPTVCRGTVRYRPGPIFDRVDIGPQPLLIRHNSVVLVPGLLSRAECAAMVRDVERYRATECAKRRWCGLPYDSINQYKQTAGLERYQLNELSPTTQAKFQQVLRGRLLPLISKRLPDTDGRTADNGGRRVVTGVG